MFASQLLYTVHTPWTSRKRLFVVWLLKTRTHSGSVQYYAHTLIRHSHSCIYTRLRKIAVSWPINAYTKVYWSVLKRSSLPDKFGTYYTFFISEKSSINVYPMVLVGDFISKFELASSLLHSSLLDSPLSLFIFWPTLGQSQMITVRIYASSKGIASYSM